MAHLTEGRFRPTPKNKLLCSVAVLAMFSTSPVLASAQEGGPALDEIIVMAQKRAQSLQDVPVQVSTIPGDTIQKLSITEASDLALLAPTLNFDSADEARLFNFSIRGIGTRSFSIGVEPSVSTVVDGVVLTRIGNAFDSLGDIEQVEVLAGPQGTLFGRNSSAGVVNIRTKGPNTEEFEGMVSVTLAENNERAYQASITGPITDTLSYRLFGFDRKNDGVAINLFDNTDENGTEAFGVKGKLLWEPSTDLSFLLSADYSENNSNCCAIAPHPTDGGQAGTGGSARYNLTTGDYDPINGFATTTPEFLGIPADEFGKFIKADVDQVSDQTNVGIALEANYDFADGYTLTSISAYREWDSYTSRDRDGSHAQLSGLNENEVAWMMGTTTFGQDASQAEVAQSRQDLAALSYNSLEFMTNSNGTLGTNNSTELNETFSQELRITSPTGEKFDYIVGAYFSNQLVERDLTIAGKMNRTAGGVAHPISNIDLVTGEVTCSTVSCYKFGDTITSVETRNLGLFGHANYHVNDKLTVFGGLRYIDEQSTWIMKNAVGPYGNHFSWLRLVESVPYLDQLASSAEGGDAGALATLTSITGDATAAAYRANSRVQNSQGALTSVDGRGTRGGQGVLEFEKDYSSSKVIYKLGAQYDISDDIMVYSSYGTGYKSPAVNADIFIFDEVGDIVNAPTEPETSKGYEIGLKGSFDRWRFDLTHYNTQIDNLHTDGSATGGGVRAVGRLIAGDVRTRGVEGNFTWAVTDALTLGGGGSIGSATIDDEDVTVGGQSADGTTILLAPKRKFNINADYEFAVGDYTASIFGTYTHTSETFYGFGENQPRDPYGLANLAFNLTSPDETWNASVFVRNVFDEKYNTSLRSVSSTQGGGAMHTIGRDHDRYFGGTLRYNF